MMLLMTFIESIDFVFFNDTATTEIYTLSLHDALPICVYLIVDLPGTTWVRFLIWMALGLAIYFLYGRSHSKLRRGEDRKSTRLNSSHANISYAVFCLKKKIISASSTSLLLPGTEIIDR